MARIAGVDLPREKRVEIGITYIYGIGRPTATKILQATGVTPTQGLKTLRKTTLQNSENTSNITLK